MSEIPDNPNFQAWLTTLETTNLPQGRDALAKEMYPNGDTSADLITGFCCLGVACTIAPDGDKFVKVDDSGESQLVTLPVTVAEWLGLGPMYKPSVRFPSTWSQLLSEAAPYDGDSPTSTPTVDVYLDCDFYARDASPVSSVAGLNDAGLTFKQIAQMIRYFGIDYVR